MSQQLRARLESTGAGASVAAVPVTVDEDGGAVSGIPLAQRASMERSELAALYAHAEANLQRAQSRRCRVEVARARADLERLEAAVLEALRTGALSDDSAALEQESATCGVAHASDELGESPARRGAAQSRRL